MSVQLQRWAVFEILVFQIRIWNTFCIWYLVFEILQIEYLVLWYFKYFFVSRCICSNTPFKILFPNTFNILSTCYFKQPCWSLHVLWVPSTSVARIRELLLSRAAAQMKNLTGSTTSTSTAENYEFFSFSVSGNEVAESDTSSVSLECLQYLEYKSTSLDSLHVASLSY